MTTMTPPLSTYIPADILALRMRLSDPAEPSYLVVRLDGSVYFEVSRNEAMVAMMEGRARLYFYANDWSQELLDPHLALQAAEQLLEEARKFWREEHFGEVD